MSFLVCANVAKPISRSAMDRNCFIFPEWDDDNGRKLNDERRKLKVYFGNAVACVSCVCSCKRTSIKHGDGVMDQRYVGGQVAEYFAIGFDYAWAWRGELDGVCLVIDYIGYAYVASFF
jgi:hypothetical protein